MNLHRHEGTPDWDNITESQRTYWQRLAVRTRGIITPSNLISLVGLIIVFFGLIELWAENYWLGLIALAFGRVLDIVDGMVAEATLTRSPLGEGVDATIDKIGTILTLIVVYAKEIVPHAAVIGLVVPQILAALIGLYAKKKRLQLHPTLQAKLGMATAWISLIGFMLLTAAGYLHTSALAWPLYAITTVSISLSLYAIKDYIKATARAK